MVATQNIPIIKEASTKCLPVTRDKKIQTIKKSNGYINSIKVNGKTINISYSSNLSESLLIQNCDAFEKELTSLISRMDEIKLTLIRNFGPFKYIDSGVKRSDKFRKLYKKLRLDSIDIDKCVDRSLYNIRLIFNVDNLNFVACNFPLLNSNFEGLQSKFFIQCNKKENSDSIHSVTFGYASIPVKYSGKVKYVGQLYKQCRAQLRHIGKNILHYKVLAFNEYFEIDGIHKMTKSQESRRMLEVDSLINIKEIVLHLSKTSVDGITVVYSIEKEEYKRFYPAADVSDNY